MVKLKDFSRLLSVFQVLFRQILFSKTFQDSPVYSSTFQACANPVKTGFLMARSISEPLFKTSVNETTVAGKNKQE